MAPPLSSTARDAGHHSSYQVRDTLAGILWSGDTLKPAPYSDPRSCITLGAQRRRRQLADDTVIVERRSGQSMAMALWALGRWIASLLRNCCTEGVYSFIHVSSENEKTRETRRQARRQAALLRISAHQICRLVKIRLLPSRAWSGNWQGTRWNLEGWGFFIKKKVK
jgi:hypothetical protein